jgi:alkylation response protein AidB-like acyl-CoA dehydrogenase
MNDDLTAFRVMVKKWIEKEITPHHEKWERDGIVPKEIFSKAGAQGLLCVTLAEAYGGMGLDFRFASVVIEEIGYAMASGVGLSIHSDIVVPYIEHYGTESQKKKWLPGCVAGTTICAIALTEPGTGSDLQNIQTKARRDGDAWILNGTKTFISNGINSNLIVVCARTSEVAPGQKFVPLSLFVVEAGMAGFERGRNLEKIGLHAQDTAELHFADVRLPAENLLGEEGKAFAYMGNELPQERLTIAAHSLGYAKRSLDLTVKYVKERKAFGKTLGEFQNTRFKLAEVATQIEAADSLYNHFQNLHIERKCTAVQASMAKLFISEVFGKTADECLQLFGGYGYMSEYPISKAYVDARVQRIYGGTNEIMKEIIARDLLK